MRRASTIPRSWLLIPATALLIGEPLAPATIVVEGTCTLVDAINAANNDDDSGGLCPPGGSGADEIVLTADVTLTVPDNETDGANALPSITTDVTVEGGGFSIVTHWDEPQDPARIFHVAGSPASLTLLNTTVSGGVEDTGGGIFNLGDVVLVNSTISDSIAREYGGGGIYNLGQLTAVYSSILDNRTTDYDIGGGGILNRGSALLIGTIVADNDTIGEYSWGGGILASRGSLRLVNSTVSGNEAAAGGAIATSRFADPTVLVHTTIANNLTFPDDYTSGALCCGDFELEGTILGNNGGGFYSGNCDATIVDKGGNLSDDDTCGPGFGNLIGLDPVLADNGGPTLTHALLAGSSAIDVAGDCLLESDQRGFAREVGLCDSGAYEFGASPLGLVESGVCPGEITLDVRGATPLGDVRISLADATGSFELPAGPCAGTVLDLDNPVAGPLVEIDADGRGVATIELQSDDCGSYAQAHDNVVCTTSAVVQFDNCYFLSASYTGSGLEPAADPSGSAGCPTGWYMPGEQIQLTAAPDPQWEVAGWGGYRR